MCSQANVRKTISDRLGDNSPAVRDAAVELLGKYLIQQPSLLQDYYGQIGERVNVSFGRQAPCFFNWDTVALYS